MKIGVIKGLSQNGVLTNFSEKFSVALNEEGIKNQLLDINNGLDGVNLDIILNGRFDLFISFNGVLSEVSIEFNGKSQGLFDFCGAKLLTWFVDDPIHHVQRLIEAPEFMGLILCSDSHLPLARELKPGAALTPMSAGTNLSDFETLIQWNEREFDFLFAGSWMGIPEPFWDSITDPNERNLVLRLLSQMDQKDFFSIYNEISPALNYLGLNSINLFDYLDLLVKAHTFMRAKLRLETILDLCSIRSAKIAVVGEQWRPLLSKYPNVQFLPESNHSSIKKYYQNSRFVICVNIENGACERVFDALEVGSIPLIEKSNKFPVSNPASKYVFEYGRSGNDRISNVAQTLLDQNVSALALEGQQYVRDHHTWNVRARELADLVAKTCT